MTGPGPVRASAAGPSAIRFAEWKRVRVHALLLAERLDLGALQPGKHLTAAPSAVPLGERGLVVLFRYGAAVFFNLDPLEEAAALERIRKAAVNPAEEPESEEAVLQIEAEGTERVGSDGVVRLRKATLERVMVVADVLAKSIVLADHENRVARVFDRIEPVAEELRRARGRSASSMRQLLTHIGDVLSAQHRMVGRVEVTEKPELLWDHPELERLYLRLHDEYELADRDRALSRKLELIAQTATTSLGLLQDRRSLRVEWYIVILILVEIVLTLYEMFVRSGGHAAG